MQKKESAKKKKQVQPASVWFRLLSFVIDLFIAVNIIGWPLAKRLSDSLAENFHATTTTALLALLTFFYFVLFERFVGATIGMAITKISISGQNTLSSAFLRNCYLIPFFPLNLLILIEPIALLGWKKRLLERWTDSTYERVVA
ncbi:MAG: RDD family protein [Candidatus Woesearchaeota archaeon]|nr:MAG: RDD family protein [Candidatus Woesearchaeota archaeon]